MISRVTVARQRLQADGALPLHPEAIRTACQAGRYTSWRDRLRNPGTTVQVFLWQILHGHTAGRHVPHLSG
jgi:hypothetical protein